MSDLEVSVVHSPGAISFNFEEIKSNLTSMMELYKDAQITEDGCIIAKKEIASLRRIKKTLNDRRIAVKKEAMKSFDDFDLKFKEINKLIDEPMELMDAQVKAFDEKKRTEKKEKVHVLYQKLIGELEEYLPLPKIYNPKWENVSTSMKSIQEEMESVISSTEMAVITIKGMNSEVTDKALEQFKADLSLANAISYINKHEQIKAEILAREEEKRKEEEERKRLAEIEKVKAEERRRVAEEERLEKERLAEIERAREDERLATEKRLMEVREPEPVETIDTEPVAESLEAPFDMEKPFEVDDSVKAIFTVTGTYDEFVQIQIYMNSIGVTWERKNL